MIPPEYRTSRGEELRGRLEALGPGHDSLEPLHEDDFALIGFYIQIYCSIEFNLRSALEVFSTSSLPGSRELRTIRPPELVPTTIDVVQNMDPNAEDIEATVAQLKEIETRRGWRNTFSHWAAKRLPGEDALVFMTKDGRDERQISGNQEVEFGHARTAIFDLADFRGLAQHLRGHETWLASKAEDWRRRYTEVDPRN